MSALDQQQEKAERRRVLRRRLLHIIGTDEMGKSVWAIEHGLAADAVFLTREALMAEIHYLVEKGHITPLTDLVKGLLPRWRGLRVSPDQVPMP